jgi:uncharacterized protein (DUF1697 family)
MRLPHLALLRGVNVGGSHRLPMRELESAFTLAGASAVKTYVQSGNVIFESNRPVDTCVDAAKAIEAQFGFRPGGHPAHRSRVADDGRGEPVPRGERSG